MRKPGLLIATLIGVAILLWLGFWQKDRLEWKTAKIAEIEAASVADPIFSMRDLLGRKERGEPVDFIRVELSHNGIATEDAYLVFRAGDGISWEVFRPVSFGDQVVFVSAEVIADGDAIPHAVLPNPVIGYARVYQPGNIEGGTYSIADNRYYGFNPDGVWSGATGARPLVYIDAELAATSAATLNPRKPDLPNNHFQYMLTWWSFAIILVIFSLILYRRPS